MLTCWCCPTPGLPFNSKNGPVRQQRQQKLVNSSLSFLSCAAMMRYSLRQSTPCADPRSELPDLCGRGISTRVHSCQSFPQNTGPKYLRVLVLSVCTQGKYGSNLALLFTAKLAMRVLISGAGIAGPTLAWFLQKAGARVTVVEKSQSLLSHGQNVDISDSAIAVIKKMGLIDEIRRFNTTEKGTQFLDPHGQPFARFPIKAGSTASPTSEFEILRGDLAAILYNAQKGHPNISYLFGTTVKEVVSNDDKAVKVQLSSGEVHMYDLLVAADGQWSRVRKQCFPPECVGVVDKGLYVAYWTTPRLASDNDWWNIYLALESRVIGLRPDPHGTIRAAVSVMPCNDAQKRAWQAASKGGKEIQEELLRKEFADVGWQAQRLLDTVAQAPDFYFQAVQQVRMSTWSSSRICCIGDAAHAPTPLTGMGTSLAIIGAYILAGELSKLGDNEHPFKAFQAYESAFRPFVERIQNIPFFVPAIVHPKTAWKRWLFQTAVWAVSKALAVPWLVNRFESSNNDHFSLPHYSSFDDKVG